MFVAEFRGDVRIILSTIVECLGNSTADVCVEAIKLLSKLAGQSMC